MTSRFSLSTTWIKRPIDSLQNFFTNAEAAGYEQFELDASISLHDIAGLSLPEGQIPSIEIPCPNHPKNVSARLGSLDRYEREAAREAALNSFQLAFDVKAQVLLVRLGHLDINLNIEKALYEAWLNGSSESQAFQHLRREIIDVRARNAELHIKAALYDVEHLATLAIDHNVKLGLVTPNIYLGFPQPEEMHIILEEFDDPVFYWHDVGQAQIFDTLALIPHNTWTDMFADNIIGIHLHNINNLAVGFPLTPDDQLTLESLKPFISDTTLITCKYASRHGADAVTKSLEYLKTALDGSDTSTPGT